MDVSPQSALHSSSPVHQPRRHRHPAPRRAAPIRFLLNLFAWRGWKFVLMLVVAVATLYTVLVFFCLMRIDRNRMLLDRLLRTAAQEFSSGLAVNDLAAMEDAAEQLGDDLENLHTLSALIRPLAPLHPALSTRLIALDSAEYLTDAVSLLFEGAAPALQHLSEERAADRVGGAEGAHLARFVDLLRLSQPTFAEARRALDAARAALAVNALAPLSESMLAEVSQLRSLIDDADAALQIVQGAPESLTRILGLSAPQTYLILAANNDEIRPSGGYVSVWGWMRIADGRAVESAFAPTTTESPAPPPAVLASSLSIPDWWVRFDEPIYAAWDGSWHADFSETAQLAAWYYDNGDNPHLPVNGVIGIDLTAVEYLLDALGGCALDDGVRVTSQNFRSIVYDIRAQGEAPLAHKQYLVDLYAQMIGAWQSADADTQTRLLNAILRALSERHLAVYFRDVNAQSAAQRLGWTGTPQVSTGDYLLFADANIAANKSSSAIERLFAYDVSLDAAGNGSAALTVFYTFSAAAAERDPAVRPEHYGRNRDYATLWQVFTPPTAQIAVDAPPDPGVRLERTDTLARFIGITTVPMGGGSRAALRYVLPGVVEPVGAYSRYRLTLEKQLGADADRYHITITLPPGCEVISAAPEASAVHDLVQQMLEYDLAVESRAQIDILYRLKDG
ncbi:MAG: DUF4012 domain-containing protein [Anaerolineae bacterium]|nr:DUF4012 domain-containing protein [Anaerolineae bacterium]